VLGKNIKIFLADGTVSGLWVAEIGQWTGRAIVVQRSKLSLLNDRDEASRTGVYVLSGPDSEDEAKDRVYIGEADDIRTRLRSHHREKEFWKRVCLFSSTDENLTKAHARYLEARLIETANRAGRSIVENGSAPKPPSLPESERSDMEHYLQHMELLLPTLGFHFTQPSATSVLRQDSDQSRSSQSPLFQLTAAGANAKAVEIDGEFVVLKGSTARRRGVPSWTTGISTKDRLTAEGVLADHTDQELLEFRTDTVFSSPSLAASVVGGRNTNGRVAWKTDSGMTYADWQAMQDTV